MKRCGFQLVEILIAVAILVVSIGSVVTLSIMANSGTKKNTDLLVAIYLAQLTMEKCLNLPYDELKALSSKFEYVYQNGAIAPGEYYQRFESLPGGDASAIVKDNFKSLHHQVSELEYEYRIDVSSMSEGGAKECTLVVVTVRWRNRGNLYDYKISSYLARKT